MRFNAIWRIDQWLPVFLAMPKCCESSAATGIWVCSAMKTGSAGGR
ncbi:MAG: DUF4188 domain-containing protein [Chloroflexota bacterium]|nr:DUF4188 domain-containing protein [Chloroflexota bacterium]